MSILTFAAAKERAEALIAQNAYLDSLPATDRKWLISDIAQLISDAWYEGHDHAVDQWRKAVTTD